MKYRYRIVWINDQAWFVALPTGIEWRTPDSRPVIIQVDGQDIFCWAHPKPPNYYERMMEGLSKYLQEVDRTTPTTYFSPPNDISYQKFLENMARAEAQDFLRLCDQTPLNPLNHSPEANPATSDNDRLQPQASIPPEK